MYWPLSHEWGPSHHLRMLGFGKSGDEARLHVFVRRNDLPVLNLLGDGAYFNQYPGQGSTDAVRLEYSTGG